MTVETNNNRVGYIGNDTLKVYSYTYRIFKEEDLKLIILNESTDVETVLVLNTDYTVDGVNELSGGSITLLDAGQEWINATSKNLDTGYTLTILRELDLLQETDLRNQGAFFPEIHEDEYDRSRQIDIQQQDQIDRSIKLPDSVDPANFNADMPASIVGQDGVSIITNPTGDGFTEGPTADEIANAQGYAVDAQNSAAAALVSENNAATSESNAATSETNAATSETNAATSETNAATSETNAATSEANALASETAAALSESNAAASAAASSWLDVIFKTFADTPIAVATTDNGYLYSIDCSGGNVVVNLPVISTLTLTTPWSVGFKKTDTSSNTITINAGGTDEIDTSGATSYVVSQPSAGVKMVPDTDPTPDAWTSLTFGEVSTLNNVTLNNPSIIDPQRLDVKKDTKANLVTYAATASNGQLCFATDEKKYYAVTDSALVDVGGGGAGDANTIHLIQSEDIDLVDIDLTGQNADFDGGGTITASSLTLSTTASDLIKSATQVIKYAPSANGQNDYFGFIKSIPQGLRGRDLGFVFEYKNDSTTIDNDFRFAVKQKDGSLINQIDYFDLEAFNTTDNNSVQFSTGNFIASDCTEVEFGWQNTSTTTTVQLLVDNILISSNPFVYKDLINEQIVRYDGFNSRSGSKVKFNTEQYNNGDNILSLDNTTFTQATANRKCTLYVGVGGYLSGSNPNISIIRYNQSAVEVERVSSTANTSQAEHFSTKFIMDTGDYVEIEATTDFTNDANFVVLKLHAQATTENLITPQENVINSIQLEGNGGEAITGGTENVVFNGTGTGWNDTNYEYTVQSDNSIITLNGTVYTTATALFGVRLYVDTGSGFTEYKGIGINISGQTTIGDADYKSTRGEFKKGDKLAIRLSTTKTLSNDNKFHYLNITEIQDAKALSATPRTYWQRKDLQSDITATGNVFTFNNLVIGKTYKLNYKLFVSGLDDASSATIATNHDGNVLSQSQVYDRGPGSSFNGADTLSEEVIFKATASTVTIDFTETGTISISSLTGRTFSILEELSQHEETTRFS